MRCLKNPKTLLECCFLIASFLLHSKSAFCQEYESHRLKLQDFGSSPKIVAIGDLHGDLQSAKKTFELAGATDTQGIWIARNTIVVQTGDILDRGPDDLALLHFLSDLESQASDLGSKLVILNGNHEFMNMQQDFRSANKESSAKFIEPLQYQLEMLISFQPFKKRRTSLKASPPDPFALGIGYQVVSESRIDPESLVYESKKSSDFFDRYDDPSHPGLAHRALAFSPGSQLFSFLASKPYFMIVGDTVFVHGGILPEAISYGLERLQEEISTWLKQDDEPRNWLSRKHFKKPPPFMNAANSPMWSRDYGHLPPDPVALWDVTPELIETCEKLDHVLENLSVKRMVIGHTIQPSRKINSACSGKVWRIDIGMSQGFNDPSQSYQVLTIQNDEVKILTQEKH